MPMKTGEAPRAATGHIELQRSIDSIFVGQRHRVDLGDLDGLAASIRRDGLLQPPTVTPDGVLLCGARRLAAMRQLGYRSVNVWVRPGVSDRLVELISERADNIHSKPLKPTEAAALYRELKRLLAEEAARRKAATEFSRHDDKTPGQDGHARLASPSTPDLDQITETADDDLSTETSSARSQAARMVTGRQSYTTLERVTTMSNAAEDPDHPDNVRDFVRAELAAVDEGASVEDAAARTHGVLAGVRRDPERQDLEVLATEALDRAKRAKREKSRRSGRAVSKAEPARYAVRSFWLVWRDLDGWWTHYDPEQVARELGPQEWQSLEATIAHTTEFFDAVRTLRLSQPESSSVPIRQNTVTS